MQDALTTLAVVVAIGAVLAVPFLLVQAAMRRRLTRAGTGKPGSAKAGRESAIPATALAARDARIAELERLLAEERRARGEIQVNLTLYAELCDRYERLIESLSPGMLRPKARSEAAE